MTDQDGDDDGDYGICHNDDDDDSDDNHAFDHDDDDNDKRIGWPGVHQWRGWPPQGWQSKCSGAMTHRKADEEEYNCDHNDNDHHGDIDDDEDKNGVLQTKVHSENEVSEVLFWKRFVRALH